ncbi:poly-gamma-glutamate hydrolase family protein [Rhizobium leguminosarum]|uniref:poly-gamma-glutamate hydrolase family protein n=1 Tax=Rhizobium leguminosarum TaxID=384 RepID=UPI001C95AD16|nr:hypothetical protein [Rhizobium leguminosarum]
MRLRTGGRRLSDRRDRSSVAIVAPHGSHIEPHTSEIAISHRRRGFFAFIHSKAESG